MYLMTITVKPASIIVQYPRSINILWRKKDWYINTGWGQVIFCFIDYRENFNFFFLQEWLLHGCYFDIYIYTPEDFLILLLPSVMDSSIPLTSLTMIKELYQTLNKRDLVFRETEERWIWRGSLSPQCFWCHLISLMREHLSIKRKNI